MSATEWKFVPVSLTDEMGEIIARRGRMCGGGAFELWDELIAAAPVPPSVESLLENWTSSDQQAFAKFRDEHFPGEMSSYAIQSLGSAWKDGQANAQPQSAAHLTIPGALEWDGDNGTHGVVGTHSADGESESPEICPREAVRDAIAEALGDAYDCTRVWSAWGVGTMSEDDFSPVCDDESRLQELTEAAIQAYDGAEVNRLRAQLANTEQSRRSFFDLSQDLEKRLVERDALLRDIELTMDGQPDSVSLGYDVEFRMAAILRPAGHAEPAAPAKLEPSREWTDSELAELFSPGSGNKAKRRIAAMEKAKAECSRCETIQAIGHLEWPCKKCGSPSSEPAKQKTCIECEQPYCHGVCVERGDQDYDRDQAAKGGDDE